MARSSDDAAQDLSAQIDVLKTDVAKLTGILSELVSGKAAATVDVAQQELDQWLKKGRSAAAKAKGSADQASASIQEAIEERPVAAVLVALAVGYVAGMLSRR